VRITNSRVTDYQIRLVKKGLWASQKQVLPPPPHKHTDLKSFFKSCHNLQNIGIQTYLMLGIAYSRTNTRYGRLFSGPCIFYSL
jgi:hypothetical protein